MPQFLPFGLLRRQSTQVAVVSALSSSAELPTSGFAFVNNSKGASAAIAELSKSLDFAIEQFDFNQQPGDQLQLHLDRLSEEAAKYRNSRLPEAAGTEWECSSAAAEPVQVAWACSAAVYEEKKVPETIGLKYTKLKHIPSSRLGTVKETALWLAEPRSANSASEAILIVAVRGTVNSIDGMVNMNGKQAPLKNLLSNYPEGFPNDVSAHAGFLGCAKTLVAHIYNDIAEALKARPDIRQILFTGHSAGGAVASLLYLHFLTEIGSDYPDRAVSLVTFGAPPVSSTLLTPFLHGVAQRRLKQGLMLAIVNEYDVVPRADGAYLRTLVNLYRSKFGLPPITDDPPSTKEQPPSAEVVEPLAHTVTNSASPTASQPKPAWKLPKPLYFIIGDIVLLRNSMVEHAGALQSRLQAFSLTHDEMADLLFCDAAVHRRRAYDSRVKLLAGGSSANE